VFWIRRNIGFKGFFYEGKLIMAKRRIITQAIICDEDFNIMPCQSRELFFRMIAISDDCGVLPGNIYTLRSLLNPPKDINGKFELYLNEILKNKLLIPFEYNKKPFFFFKRSSFEENQAYLIKNRTKSEYLKISVEDYKLLYNQVLGNFQKIRENTVNYSDNDSYHIERKEIRDKSKKIKDKSKEIKEENFDFEFLWNSYPRKLGKKESIKHLQANIKTEKDFEDCKNAINNYKQELIKNKTEEKYIKHGSTFFNNWKDYIEIQTNPVNNLETLIDLTYPNIKETIKIIEKNTGYKIANNDSEEIAKVMYNKVIEKNNLEFTEKLKYDLINQIKKMI
jgi:RNAse (barnase) inhibitor barstar